MKEYDEGEMRRAQENVAKMIRGGFHKDFALAARAFCNAFIEQGFTRQEALELTKVLISPKVEK